MNDYEKHILSKLEAYCAKAEHCIDDIYKKLKHYNLTLEVKQNMIISLVDNNFINEERYTKAFVNDKYKFNKWGKNKIRYQLKMKNIPQKIINEKLNDIKDDIYLENLRYIIDNKKVNAKNDYEYKQKMLRFLYSKGYDTEICLKILEE